MALGRTDITVIQTDQAEIDHCVGTNHANFPGMRKSWETFEYVSRNLSEWADETTVGANVRDELNKLVNLLDQLLTNTKSLNGRITRFVDEQIRNNNGQW